MHHDAPDSSISASPTRTPVSFSEALWVWAKIGALSFGGPAGQIAMMHDELVNRRKWIPEARFLHALNYCMMLPGPEAQQLATYLGWLLHRTPGGLAAGLLFIVPGAVTMLAFSSIYVHFGTLDNVTHFLWGMKAAVLAMVIAALVRLSKRTLQSRFAIGLAAVAFVGLSVFHLPFPAIILGAALLGLARHARVPGPLPSAETTSASSETPVDQLSAAGQMQNEKPSLRYFCLVLAGAALCWVAPFVALALFDSGATTLQDEAVFFSKTAVVTFGGAYSVLTYVAHEAVETFRWVSAGEMLDGLGLAETTPGPLILVLEFVGFVGAFRNPGHLTPSVSGLLGAAITLWVSFVPSFAFIFLGAPFVESARQRPAVRAGLSGIGAAVVGAMANVAFWFAVHFLFRQTTVFEWKWVRVEHPLLSSIDASAVIFVGIALFALFRLKVSVPVLLSVAALSGMLWRLVA